MNQIDNIKSFTSDLRFDVVGLTCGMKSVLITATFNIGTGGAIPVVAPKGTGGGSGVTGVGYCFKVCSFHSFGYQPGYQQDIRLSH